MPSLTHEALVQLFRDHPALAVQLLRILGMDVPAYDQIRVDSSDLSQTAPTEYRADLVILLSHDEPVMALVIEVQLGVDADKRYSWPVYVTTLRANVRCTTHLLVVTPDEAVARWAAVPIDLGAGSVLAPLVLGPDAIPTVEDIAAARTAPELAVLSAMAHGADADAERAARIALAAIAACLDLDNDQALFYADVVQVALRGAARIALEALMQSPQHREFQSEFARKHVAIGRAEDVVRILEHRGVALSDDQRARILGCTDLATLEQWFDRALDATATDELFG